MKFILTADRNNAKSKMIQRSIIFKEKNIKLYKLKKIKHKVFNVTMQNELGFRTKIV